MTAVSRFCVIVASFSLLSAQAARAKLHKGIALIPPGPVWDFSDSTNVFPPDGDVSWATVEFGVSLSSTESSRFLTPAPALSELFHAWAPALVGYAPGDSTYADLMTAPTDENAYSWGVPFLFGDGAYVVRTKEFHYAKMRIWQYGGGGIWIEYTYQDNGTNVLVEPVPVRPMTWGRIKSLYR